MMCEYTDDYETVKSQGDITLEKFGLTVECPICEESISAYNQDSINRHLRKHEKEAASETLEADNVVMQPDRHFAGRYSRPDGVINQFSQQRTS